MAFFFVAVSTKENLELCEKYGLAGLPSTYNGLWGYLEMNVGDYITFLYGARAHNLYKIVKKEAIADARDMPPWKPLEFSSGTVADFPYRFNLEKIRSLNERIAKQEFAYIAENLLLRGGYRKSHFQADQTTLQNVSQMGKAFNGQTSNLTLPTYKTFVPKFIRKRGRNFPVFQFQEIILQSIIRQYLSKRNNFINFAEKFKINEFAELDIEVLGEKALPEGHVDLLIKESRPIGTARQIVVETKLTPAKEENVQQLYQYMSSIGSECEAGILIAERFPKKLTPPSGMSFCRYQFENVDIHKNPYSFGELLSSLKFSPIRE